jgi:hypothetical protein
MDSVTTEAVKSDEQVRSDWLDRFPDWSRFPVFMFLVTIVLVVFFSAFIHNVLALLIPSCAVCTMVAVANLSARRLGLDQD